MAGVDIPYCFVAYRADFKSGFHSLHRLVQSLPWAPLRNVPSKVNEIEFDLARQVAATFD